MSGTSSEGVLVWFPRPGLPLEVLTATAAALVLAQLMDKMNGALRADTASLRCACCMPLCPIDWLSACSREQLC